MNKQYRNSILISCIVAIVTTIAIFGFLNAFSHKDVLQNPEYSPVYDRIIKAKTIRCGYVVYPPGSIKDPNTGELSGVFVDAMEAVGKSLGLDIQWTEEVGWGSMIEGLNAGRYDIIGSPVWANSTRSKHADFTTALFFSGIGVYVRTDDHRFDMGLSSIDNPAIKVATIDGEMSTIIADQDFPRATRVSHTQMSDNSQILLDVNEGKADVTFVEPWVAEQFMRSRPNSLKNIRQDHPIRVFPNTMMLPQGEYKLKQMLDVALSEVLNSGMVDVLLTKYAGGTSAFYSVAYPYRTDK